MPKEISPIKQKILLLLLTGVALGFTYAPNRQLKIIKGAVKAWEKINQEKLKKDIRELYQSKMVELKENSDGSFTMVLTQKGKMKILNYHFQQMKINPPLWDKKWRLVIFDVPEKLRKGRDALREKLKKLGFYELQKSVFVFPYECRDEVDFLIEIFDLRRYVRCGILEWIDNELHLKKIFRLV